MGAFNSRFRQMFYAMAYYEATKLLPTGYPMPILGEPLLLCRNGTMMARREAMDLIRGPSCAERITLRLRLLRAELDAFMASMAV